MVSDRVICFGTFLASCAAIALLCGSLASQHWVVSTAHRESNAKSEGRINFGLFWGTRRLNHGFGERVYEMDVMEVQYRERDFLVRELYVTTISCVCGAVLFGLLGAGLALHNTAGNPKEAICHYPGVVGMNVMSFVLSLAAVVTWLAQFFLRLRKNVLIREDIANGGWNSEGEATVGYSFWLVFIASIVFFANSAMILLLQRKRARKVQARTQVIEAATKPNGNLMLY